MKENYIIEDSILTALTAEGKRQGILVLPEGITDISYGVFNNSCVKEITFPSSLKQIPEGILMDHRELKKVIISIGTERILESAFEACPSLRDVTIPDSVTAIERFAFRNCVSLKSLYLPESVNMIDIGVFSRCSALEEISIPSGVEYLHDDTFSGCKSLKEIRLPDSLRMIYEEPFWGCDSLRTITIPESVSWIHEGAFRGCLALTDIFINSDRKELLNGVYIRKNCRVHRPDAPVRSVRKMTDEEAKKAYFEVCRHEFPIIVETVENYCSAGPDGTFEHGEYRTKEEVLDFALMLIENFGPYPFDRGLISDAWDYAFEYWNETCPPHPELKACGTDAMSEESISEWFEKNSGIGISASSDPGQAGKRK